MRRLATAGAGGILLAAVALAGACDRPSVLLCGSTSGSSLTSDDILFRRDPSFLGADGAYSASLGGDRVLWMFGDSFVKKTGSTSRRDSAFVRNTVAVQTGRDPTSASLQYFWRGGSAAPSSFVPEAKDVWYWPMGAALGNGRLFLFYVAEKAGSGGLGFEAAGNRVMTVDDPSLPPLAWTMVDRTFPVPAGSYTLLAPLVDGDQLWVYAIHEPDHAVSVARVRLNDAALGDFSGALWWCGDRGWRAAAEVGAGPASIFPSSTKTDLPSELSVSRRPDGSFVAVHSVGFGATKIALRTAAKLEGPWSDACPFFEPPESRGSNPFVYAGKGHAELSAGDNLLVTYVANSTDDQKLLDDPTLYWPRFVNASLAPADAGTADGDR